VLFSANRSDPTVPSLTQHMAVLGEEGRVGPEVDSTADHVQRAKFGSVCLARCAVAENLSIVAMICVRVGLPAWNSTQGDFGAGEADTDHPSTDKLAWVYTQR
jgi:hypothetical protein